MKKIIFGIFMIMNLTSCVGYSVLTGETITREKTDQGTKYTINDKAGILQMYGKPAKIETKDGKEYWTFKENLAVRGVVIALLVPIPLIVPTGYNHVVFEFEKDIRTRTTIQRNNNSSAFMCGFLPTGETIAFDCNKK